jgi:uncharacterized membrane protein YciS (DUF1049 family)
VRYENENGDSALQSLFVAHSLLNVPYEMVSVSITLFIVGLGVYLGSAWKRKLKISVANGESVGNVGVAVAFIAGTVFGWLLFGFLIGQKNVENQRSEQNFNDRES